jgi:hypothetical protein
MGKLAYDAILKIISFSISGLLSLSLLGFCFYKLTKNGSDPIYLSLLSSIISIYIPSPTSLLQGISVNSIKKDIEKNDNVEVIVDNATTSV